MKTRNLRRQFQNSSGTISILAVVGYFLYHLFAGNHGIRAEARLKKDLAQAQEKLKELEIEQALIQKKVRYLHPESLDRDLLDQRVRETLAYSDPHEVIFVHPENPENP